MYLNSFICTQILNNDITHNGTFSRKVSISASESFSADPVFMMRSQKDEISSAVLNLPTSRFTSSTKASFSARWNRALP